MQRAKKSREHVNSATGAYLSGAMEKWHSAFEVDHAEAQWAAAGFIDTLLRWKMKLEVEDGYQKEIQPGVQIRGCQAG